MSTQRRAPRRDVIRATETRLALPAGERLIPFDQIDRLAWLPRRRDGKPPHRSFWHRAATRGVNGIRLKFVRVGKLRCTIEPWLREFFVEQTRAGESGNVAHGRNSDSG